MIGYDARHNSDVFARDTAEVMTGAGLRALVLPRPLPTPLLAFAIRELGCVAGVMVTASHNPPRDNGYKVYLGDGSQIVPPADAEIAAQIEAVGAARRRARAATAGRSSATASSTPTSTPSPVSPATAPATCAWPTRRSTASAVPRSCRCSRPPGFDAPYVVAQQEQPDADFPTVSFPNPEEPGAMDLAMALAAERGVDLVVANDPDADRCAAAVPDAARLADAAGGRGRCPAGPPPAHRRAHRHVRLLDRVLEPARARWPRRPGSRSPRPSPASSGSARSTGLVFGYEEALGYCVDPEHVKDKDGVSALLLLCELAAAEKAQGRTLVDVLDDLALAHGLHATDQLSVRVTDLAADRRGDGPAAGRPPTSLGGLRSSGSTTCPRGSGGLPPTDGLRYRLADGARVIVRPSGTEPKLKCYLEVVVPVDADAGVDAARISAAARLDALRDDIRAAAFGELRTLSSADHARG